MRCDVQHQPTVYLVDHDVDLSDSLKWLIESGGFCYRPFANAQDFLSNFDSEAVGCLLLDLRLPDKSGFELFAELEDRNVEIPVIFMTGYGDVSVAVRAFRAGAFDFIEKPCDRTFLLERIGRAVSSDAQRRRRQAEREYLEKRMAVLSQAESEVLDRILSGESNKQMAAALSVTERAVEYRRSGLMKKLGAQSVAELVRLATIYEQADDIGRQYHVHAAHRSLNPHVGDEAISISGHRGESR